MNSYERFMYKMAYILDKKKEKGDNAVPLPEPDSGSAELKPPPGKKPHNWMQDDTKKPPKNILDTKKDYKPIPQRG